MNQVETLHTINVKINEKLTPISIAISSCFPSCHDKIFASIAESPHFFLKDYINAIAPHQAKQNKEINYK